MPHSYSAEAKQRRLGRASLRGYIQPRPRGQHYVLVDAGFREAVRAAYKSMRLHLDHDGLSGTVHHHGRLASLAARRGDHIDDEEFCRASRAHRLAGKLKHNVSRQWRRVDSGTHVAEEPDELFCKDPWAGKSLGERAAASCEGDAWDSWLARRDKSCGFEAAESCEFEAIESCEFEAVGAQGLCALLDVITNEVLRILTNETGAGADRIYETLPVSSGDESDVESGVPPASSEEGYIDVYNHEETIRTHMGVLRAFVREWELFQQLSTFEAECLGACSREGEDDWWNDTLSTASRLESYSTVLDCGETYMREELVVQKVSTNFGMQDNSIGDEIALALRGAGLRDCSLHACAWVLLLALAGCEDDPTGCGDDERDLKGVGGSASNAFGFGGVPSD